MSGRTQKRKPYLPAELAARIQRSIGPGALVEVREACRQAYCRGVTKGANDDKWKARADQYERAWREQYAWAGECQEGARAALRKLKRTAQVWALIGATAGAVVALAGVGAFLAGGAV